MTPKRRAAVSVAAIAVAAALGFAAWTQVDPRGSDADAEYDNEAIADAVAERATVAAEPLPTVAPVEIGDVTVETGGSYLGPVVHDTTGRYDWRARVIGGGGWITGLETHPSEENFVVARADNGGAFLWDEETATWQQLIRHSNMPDPSQSDFEVESVAIPATATDRIYLSIGNNKNNPEGRVMVSDDRGATWSTSTQRFAIQGNGVERQGGERLVADPTDADVVWLGTRSEGLWVSRDGAMSWDMVFQPVVASEPVGISWVELGRDGEVYLGVSGVGVLIGSADGAFEVLIASESVAGDAEVDSQGRLWATDPDAQVVHRYDPETGDIDSMSPGATRILTVGTHPTLASHVVLKNNNVMWTTTDDGENWTQRSQNLTCVIPWIEAIFKGSFVTSSPEVDPVNPDRLWAPVGIGVLISDSGNLWGSGDLDFRCEVEGIEQMVVNEIVVPISDEPLSLQWDRPLFFHSAGGLLPPLTGPTLRFNAAWDIDISPSDPNVMVATIGDPRNCCRDDESFASVKSVDGGLTWQQFGSHTSGTHPFDLRYGNIAISATDPDNMVWMPTFNRPVHFTRDGGETWTSVVLPGTEDELDDNGNYVGGSHNQKFLRRFAVAADRVAADTFYLYHQDLGMMRSVDGGETWAQISDESLPTGWTVGHFSVHVDIDPVTEGHLYFTSGPLQGKEWPFYESFDGGETWTEIEGFAAVAAMGFGAPLTADGPLTLFVAGSYEGVRGVYRSGDGGESWEQIAVAPADNHSRITAVAGDPEIPGRVYIGFNGSSIVQGDDPELITE